MTDIAEGMRVLAQRLVIAEGGIDPAKVGGGDVLGRSDLIALEAGGVGAVQIVVAREDEDGDALRFERGALGGERLVALALAVEGEVAGEDQRRGMLNYGAVKERVGDLPDALHILPVGVRDDAEERLPAVGEARREKVRVRGDQNRHGLHGDIGHGGSLLSGRQMRKQQERRCGKAQKQNGCFPIHTIHS